MAELPRIRRHKRSGTRADRVYVTLSGQRFYLGSGADAGIMAERFNRAVEEAEKPGPPLNADDMNAIEAEFDELEDELSGRAPANS